MANLMGLFFVIGLGASPDPIHLSTSCASRTTRNLSNSDLILFLPALFDMCLVYPVLLVDGKLMKTTIQSHNIYSSNIFVGVVVVGFIVFLPVAL